MFKTPKSNLEGNIVKINVKSSIIKSIKPPIMFTHFCIVLACKPSCPSLTLRVINNNLQLLLYFNLPVVIYYTYYSLRC